MNQLHLSKRTQIIKLLVDGNSLRDTSRIADVSINTVTKLLLEVGQACEQFHDDTVLNLKTLRLHVDKIWSFSYAMAKNVPAEKQGEACDVWTWTALDPDSKLIVSWFVGDRSQSSALIFISDAASRIAAERIQISTDGDWNYAAPIGKDSPGMVDYGMYIKTYGTYPSAKKGKYSPTVCIDYKRTAVHGNPASEHVSKSHIEKPNLHTKRFTRPINGFCKKIDNHMCAIAFHFVYYNFLKVHRTLHVTPAMEAGLTKKPMTIEEMVELKNTYKLH